MAMAAKKLPASSASTDNDKLTPFNMRMPDSLLEALDAWVDDLNKGRALGKVTRSDLIRVVLEKACRDRPDLEGK